MYKCRLLAEANVDEYMLDTMIFEELAMQDVIQATTTDFACTVDQLKHNPNNPHLLRHTYELMQFMQTDESFHFMDMEPDTYIEMMLSSAGFTVNDVLTRIIRGKAKLKNPIGGISAKISPEMVAFPPERRRNPSYNIHGGWNVRA